MALTNQTSRDISANINAGNVNDNVEVERTERVRKLSPEAAILFNKSIVARPLNTPEVCSIHVKDTSFYYRWVASQALGGQVYMQRKAMGFVNATTDDVDILVGDAVADKGGITAGDLILMKLPFDKWAAHVKSNMLKAQERANQGMRGQYRHGGSTDVFSDAKQGSASVSSEPFNRNSQISHFSPNADAIIDDSIKSGRVEQTRAALQERQNSK